MRALLDMYGHAALVAVSASEDRRDAAAALRAGARAFVSKSVSNEVLGNTVLRVLTGRLTKSEWITPEGVREVVEDPGPELTQRQRQVLALIRRGYTNKEIGLHLGLAEATVKQHLSSLFRMLDVRTRTQLVLAASRLGVVTRPCIARFEE